MQDLRTGNMLTFEQQQIFDQLKTHEGNFMKALQALKDAAVPREHQGPVFQEGEILWLRGGKFTIEKISPEGLVLRGLPAKQ